MKIIVEKNDNLTETEIIIRCRDEHDKIIESIRMLDSVIYARLDGSSYLIRSHEIFYIESVDDKVFIYTSDKVYNTDRKLYQFEEALTRSAFIRVSKSVILNAAKIKHFTSSSNGRMQATLINGERVDISRNYVPSLKALLGEKK